MKTTNHISKLLHDLFFGGNWTGTNLKDSIASITLEEANTKIGDCNTIAVLLFHINYYVEGTIPVLNGGTLDIKDKYSFDAPEIKTETDWDAFKTKVLENAKSLIQDISSLEDDMLFQTFVDEKYGTYYRNLHGIIEHTHYHLGQINVLLKQMRA